MVLEYFIPLLEYFSDTPGFDIFQKPNENVLLVLYFLIFFACVLVKGIFHF